MSEETKQGLIIASATTIFLLSVVAGFTSSSLYASRVSLEQSRVPLEMARIQTTDQAQVLQKQRTEEAKANAEAEMWRHAK